MRRTVLIATLLALVAVSCGDADGRTDEAPLPPAAALCDDPGVECDDTPDDGGLYAPGEPTDGLAPDAGSGMLVDGGLTIEEALTTDAVGTLAIKGFYVHDGTEGRLCSLLAESLPPQCGGASLLFDGSGIDPSLLSFAQGVTWTDHLVSVIGELVDGRLVADPLSI